MSRRTLFVLAVPAVLVVLSLASTAPACAQSNPIPNPGSLPNPDGIFTTLQGQATTIRANIAAFANALFLGLATLDVFWTVAQAMLGGRGDVLELMVAVLQKFVVLNLVYWIFVVNGFNIVVGIINQFVALGTGTEGQLAAGAPTDPISIFAQGIVYAVPAIIEVIVFGAIPDLFLGTGSTNLWTGIINLETINAALIVGSYTFLAGTLALALFEAYVVTASGIFVTGFLGSRWTSSLGEKYFSYAISVGVKLLMVYICIGLLQPLGPFVQATAGVPILGGFIALAAAIVAYSAPSFAASIISGSSNSNFGQFSGMLMNLASTSLSSVSNAIKGYAEAGEEAALTAVSLGAVAATGGAAAPALAGGELAVTAPETTLGASEFGGATSPARSGGMPSSTGGASGTPSGNSGSGGGASELDNIDILNMLPEEDAATQAITSPFDGFAGITNTVATLSPSDPHSSTGAVSIRIGV